MINRLHADGAERASIGTPSFDEDFVGESSDDLRKEFLDLLDQVASTARRASQTEDAIGASIVAAGTVAFATPRPAEVKKGPELKNTSLDSSPVSIDKGGAACSTPHAQPSRETGISTTEAQHQGVTTEQKPQENSDDSPTPSNVQTAADQTGQQSEVSDSDGGSNQLSQEQVEVKELAETALVDGAEIAIDTAAPEASSQEAAQLVSDAEAVLPEEGEVPSPTFEALPVQVASDLSNGEKIAQTNPDLPVNDTLQAANSAGSDPKSSGQAVDVSNASTVDSATTTVAGENATTQSAPSVPIPDFQGNSVNLQFKAGERTDGAISAAAVATAFLQRPDAAIKFALLKETFEHVKGGISELKNSHGATTSANHQSANAAQGPQNGAFLDGNIGRGGSQGVLKESSRPLPKGLAGRTLERVESAIKEAAKSRDGKTLSFRLDPPQLGQVKVDVTLKEGGLHARLVPENQQVATLLRERAPELQSTLRRLGLNVDTVTVSVGNEQAAVSNGGTDNSQNGKSFQQGRNKLPGQGDQLVETTFGNELALHGEAMVIRQDDHWVA